MDILLVPEECDKLICVSLPRPKDSQLQHYLYDEDKIALYEIVKYTDEFRSWFLDNQFCKSGHFNILTKVDPLFIFIPELMKFCKEQFRTLHDICQLYASNSSSEFSKIEYALAPDIDWSEVCDTKELDSELFVRFSESKTLDWLVAKHKRTMESLQVSLGEQASKATLISYANDLIDFYIPTSLSDKFKNITRANAVESKQQKVEAPIPKQGSKRPSEQTSSKPSKGSILQYFKK